MKLESTLKARGGLLPFSALIDIIFLLLLFFLLSSNAVVRSGIAVTPPQSRSALHAAAAADIVTISASTPLGVFFNDRPVTMEELGAELSDRSGDPERKQIILRADRAAPFGQVIDISNLVMEHGFEPIFATRSEIKS